MIGELITAAAVAHKLYTDLQRLAVAQGWSVEEFDASVAREAKRLSSWLKATDAAEDAALKGDSN